MKRRLFLQGSGALIALGVSGHVPAEGLMPELSAEASARLSDFIGKEMLTRHIPGLSACLVHKDGHILWSGNFGYANLETNEVMRFDHFQNIASISKTFVTLAAMQQVEAGLMSLDDAVSQHLPFELRHPQHAEKAITVRMLMRHESGLRDGSVYARNYACGDPKISLGVWVREYFKEGGVFYSADENFAPWAPGDAYEYTNTTFGLLGHLVERTSGLSLPEYCNRNIIAPMGLTGTAWMLSDLNTEIHTIPYTWVEDSAVRGSSWGGVPLGVIRPDGPTYAQVLSDGFHKNCFYNHPNYPDGFLRMSMLDVTQWARLWLNDGKVDGIRMLKKASVDQMFRDEAAGPHAESLQGLTWHSGHAMNGMRLWGHDGSDPGVATSLLLAREAGLAAIVFTNTDGVAPSDFTTAILREALEAAWE